jgi:hypothetical protein
LNVFFMVKILYPAAFSKFVIDTGLNSWGCSSE